MYSFVIRSAVEQLRSGSDLSAVAGRLENDQKLAEAFRLASFDVSCQVVECLGQLADARLRELLVQKLLSGRIEGIKKTPLPLVRAYLELMVDRCTLGLREGCVNHVSELKKLEEIVRLDKGNSYREDRKQWYCNHKFACFDSFDDRVIKEQCNITGHFL